MTLSEKLPEVEDVYRLSPMQRMMLLHSLSNPSSRVLSNQFCYELRGDLDAMAFRRAWQALVDRHTALRTAVLWEDLPHPVQVVHRKAELSFQQIDLRTLPEPGRQERLRELREEDSGRAFDLVTAPLMRLTLAQTADDSHFLIWNSHHLIIDRWSLAVVFDDLSTFYRAELNGIPASLPAPGRFRDYIAWIARQDRESAESYWRSALRGLQGPSLVADGGATASSFRRQREASERALSPELCAGLREMARSEGLTLAALLQGGIGLWLAALTGQSDVVLGTTVSGRPADLPGAETTVGSFINNLPMRVRLDSKEPLVPWLRALQISQARRNRYEYVAAHDVHEWSSLTGASPLFDVLTLINPGAGSATEWPGFEMLPTSSEFTTSYPLTLAVGDSGGQLRLRFVCDPDRFATARAEAALDDLVQHLSAISTGAGKTLGELVSLPEPTGAPPLRPSPSARSASARALEGSPAEIVLAIWQEALGVDHVGLDEDLFALGATSLQIAQAFYHIEKQLDRALPLSTLFDASSVRDLLRVLDQPSERSSSLVAIRPRGTRPQLFVVPGMGGNVVGLSGLARALGPDQPFYGLESKGLDGHDAPATSVEEIAEDYLSEMIETAREPFALAGICWGASVAFEMAHRLAAAGRPPALLALMDPTHVEGPQKPRGVGDARVKFVAARLALYWQEFRRASPTGRRRLMREKIGRALDLLRNRAPAPEVQMEMNQFRVSDANLTAVLRYRPRVYRGPACLFFTAERSEEGGAKEREAWRELIDPEPPVVYTPGRDTGDALSAVNVGDFADALRREIDGCTERAGTE
jgi:thioesterase domain-containing protein/acyl carrier protein